MGFLCAQRSWIGGLCAALMVASAAADQSALPAPFRDAIERGIDNGAYDSLAVGLIDGQRHATFYFGHRAGSAAKRADDDSLFEIGAISEVFTGLLLAQAAVEGKLQLSDPIKKFLPEGFPFTDPQVGNIALNQLVTQHSGLPTQVANLFPADLDDPYADYASEDLLTLLAFQHGAEHAAEPDYAYSVVNAGLLGHLLGRAYRTAYPELLANKILIPLGMKHTSFADDADLLHGHARGEPAAHWHYGVLAGAAGLRASVPDLLAFLQHNLTPEDSPLRAALLLARQPYAAGPADRIGFGWNVREKIDDTQTWPFVWRASRTGGFSSFIGYRTDEQKAIVLLGNTTEDIAALGIAWLGEKMPPPTPHASRSANTNRLGEYPGLYRIATGREAIVRAGSSALSLQLPGALPQRLRAADKDVFVADNDAIGVTFMRTFDDVTGLVLHTNEGSTSAPRLSTGAPHLTRVPIQTSAAEVNALPGDYRLDDEHWLRISESARQMILQWTLGERRSIFPYAPDRYTDTDGMLNLTFHRNARGQVETITLDLAGVQREALPLRRSAPSRKTP
jgi:CubicO group peptidase (beta-lactamase class C family)